MASAVLTAAETWRLFGRAVEKARLAGKKAVSSAMDVAGVEAAEATVLAGNRTCHLTGLVPLAAWKET